MAAAACGKSVVAFMRWLVGRSLAHGPAASCANECRSLQGLRTGSTSTHSGENLPIARFSITVSKEALETKPAAPRTVARYASDMDVPTHNMLGLAALIDSLAELGVATRDLFAGTGIAPEAISDPHARISHRQKIAFFGNVHRLS